MHTTRYTQITMKREIYLSVNRGFVGNFVGSKRGRLYFTVEIVFESNNIRDHQNFKN